MAEMNITDILNKWGEIYTPEGQTAVSIKTQLFEAADTSMDFRTVPHEGSVYKSAYASHDEVLQAYGIEFLDKGTGTFKAWECLMGEFKIDRKFSPDKFKNSWLGFLHGLPEQDRTKWPIILWYITKLLLPSAAETFEKDVAYWGWKATGYDADIAVDETTLSRVLDEAAVRPANASMDGIRTQIIRMVADGRITPIATGAPSATAATWCGQVETFMAGIDPAVRAKITTVYMSEVLWRRYRQGRRDKYNVNYLQESDLNAIADYPNVEVVFRRSMDGSNKIWATPTDNKIRPVRFAQNGRFDTQKDGRYVSLLSDWDLLLTFEVPEFIATNDVENAITDTEAKARYNKPV